MTFNQVLLLLFAIAEQVRERMPAETTSRICENAIDMVGNTPLVYLNKVTKGLDAKIAVKAEYMNPACSVKDRAANAMIERAEREGKIEPGKSVLIEATR